MHTTSRTRRALITLTGTAFALSTLAGCAESSADDPATGPDEAETAIVEDAKKYVGDPWERRLIEEHMDQERDGTKAGR